MFGRSVDENAPDAVWLTDVFGLSGSPAGQEVGPDRVRGLAVIETAAGRYEADRLPLADLVAAGTTFHFRWHTAAEDVDLISTWTAEPASGVWRRSDILHNAGESTVRLRRCQARFVFAPGRYEVYSQRSGWCDENQGVWQPLHHGAIDLGCEGGRTCQGGTPYAVLRDAASQAAVAFHILPVGNWRIRIVAAATEPGADSLPFAVVELGLSAEGLDLALEPGEAISLPDVLFQAVPEGAPHAAAPALHRHLLATLYKNAKPVAPVVYNTWFDVFEHIELPRLRDQLAAAKEVGCEVFVVDAGWYGAQAGDWGLQTGDWREKLDGAFHGRMREFADEVRAAGLGFGLWMEPERIGPMAPIRSQHPDWFVPVAHGFSRPRIEDEQVYAYLRGEISRLIETYDLAWLKVDFNHELGNDPSHTALHDYYTNWYRMLGELRAQFPNVFLEGCASGGMRSDALTLSRFDNHFLSDTVEPVDVLRIYQGALLRLPPGRIGKWAVVRSVGQTIPVYGVPLAQTPASIVVPGGAIWTPSITCDLDFVTRVAMCGMLGLSGDLAGLPAQAQQRMRHHVAFYKQWREFIAGSVAHLLTPPAGRKDRAGWAAIQLQHPAHESALVFVYRLDDVSAVRSIHLRDLNPERAYTVIDDEGEPVAGRRLGADLMDAGLPVTLPAKNSAAVLVIQPVD